MGCFSWLDCSPNWSNKTGKYIHTNILADDTISILLPEGISDKILEKFPEAKNFYNEAQNSLRGQYDGYGRLVDFVDADERVSIDVYDLVAYMNLRCVDTKEAYDIIQNTRAVSQQQYPKMDDTATIERLQNYADFEEIFVGKDEPKYLNELRNLGIDIACGDEEQARLHYPIKMTYDKKIKYEEVQFSPSDPNQGMSRLNQRDYEEKIEKRNNLISEWKQHSNTPLEKEDEEVNIERE